MFRWVSRFRPPARRLSCNNPHPITATAHPNPELTGFVLLWEFLILSQILCQLGGGKPSPFCARPSAEVMLILPEERQPPSGIRARISYGDRSPLRPLLISVLEIFPHWHLSPQPLTTEASAAPSRKTGSFFLPSLIASAPPARASQPLTCWLFSNIARACGRKTTGK